MELEVIDIFGGPGGWAEACNRLGLLEVGVEKELTPCLTRQAAGHLVIQADVATMPVKVRRSTLRGLIGSPPCPDYSPAGKRAGLASERGQLVWQVVYWAHALDPEWIACEQVPQVLPIWQSFAWQLRQYGYKTWTGILCAADYGVPQTRQRAFLLAHRHRQPTPPAPTHARNAEVDLFGGGVQPWVSFADALGWGPNEPAHTITGGGARTGGWEPFANAAYRHRLAEMFVDRRTNSKDGRGGMVPTVPVSVLRPAPTLTGKAASGQWLIRGPDDESRNLTIREASVLQGFRPDYPWQGNKGQQGQQVGDAVPPPLAAHVLSALTGLPLSQEVVAA